MRRFSSKNHLVTLSEINITPLLDLAFVLLIIFIITTPLLENSIEIKLPPGGIRTQQVTDPARVRMVEVEQTGRIRMDKQWMSLAQVKQKLAAFASTRKDAVVVIRGDGETAYKNAIAVLNAAREVGIYDVDLKTSPK